MSALAKPAAAPDFLDMKDLDLYRVFAYAFGLPARERFDWLSRADSQAGLTLLCEEYGVSAPHEPRVFARYADYEAAYLSLFEVGLPEPPVPLLESSHHRAVPAQQIVLDCVNFYMVLGLRHQGSSYSADHLVTQLEFLAAARFAREAAADAEKRSELLRLERDFIERHLLIWLPVAAAKLEKLDPPLFPPLLRLVHAFLAKRMESLSERALE